MTNRPFLFLSGEYKVSLPIVYSKSNWQHSMSANYLDFDATLHRRNRNEDIKGIMLYADMDNKEIEKHNLHSIIEFNVPCYPDPFLLLEYLDRHKLHKTILSEIKGSDNDPELYNYAESYKNLPDLINEKLENGPLVLKTGLCHRGENKYLLKSIEDFNQVQPFEGLFTLGPFYKGDSVRVLFIEDKVFVIEVQNDDSWIKNTAGANIILRNELDYDSRLIDHAKKVKDYLYLDIVGIDYIVNKQDNKMYFLEANYFPDLNVSDKAVEVAKTFFLKKMDEIENSKG